nr:biotin--[acetyl-CoA-carboxylase] ligase [Sneathiella limimaris]
MPSFFTLTAFQTIDSTNLAARKLADEGASEGQVIWALKQESGVGRRGRQWTSPEGNLYCSVLLRPNVSAVEGAKLSFLVAVALFDALKPYLPESIDLAVKWPNDLLINGRKTAGILLESRSNNDGRLDWLIIGTGINIRHYPKVTDGLPAISLEEVGAKLTTDQLLKSYLDNLLQLYQLWKQEGFSPIRQRWLARASGVGGPVTVRLSNEQFEGVFSGMDENGALVLTLPDGSTRLVTAGEVFLPTYK